jgi:UDP-N-acetylglucosamine--N-acetylmuramyl-(pentapeptide) pyrophosphoryl-undecaprenol N-acetylglucosamine transferase
VSGPIVIAGGGTAGHVFPGLSLGRALTNRGRRVVFVGTAEGPEARLVPEAGFEFHAIPVHPFVRRVSTDALRGPTAAVRAVGRCREIVRGGAAVVGLGGYASVPAILAAKRERVPVVLQEQNAVAGLANRVLSRLAATVALGFADAGSFFPRRRVVVTGNPVREEILAVRVNREALAAEARSRFDLDPGRSTVLIVGGSQGALHLNQATVGACALLAERGDLQLLLIAGPAHADEMRRALGDVSRALAVRVEGFVDHIDLAYAVADLVVARAGASSIAEIAVCGLPALLVPYPHATAGHQEANARALQRAGGAAVLPDDELSPETLADRIATLIDQRDRRAAMSVRSLAFAAPDATDRLADAVEDVAA